MSETARIGAVVLAGGRSSRFGRDKLAEPMGGRPMLDHAIDAVLAVAQDVIVVTAPALARLDLPADVRSIADRVAFEGPLAGLATGLRGLAVDVDRAIVVGGDMPTLVPAVLDRLVAALERHDLAVLADAERPRPMPLAIRRGAGLAAADRLLGSGDRRLRALLDAIPTIAIPPAVWRLDDPDGATLRDVDVPEDLPD